jgi:outer membrane receptor protein involved in Fe transport
MKKCINLLIVLLPICLFAQHQLISGTVVDSAEKKPLHYATVGVYAKTNLEKPLQNIFASGKGQFQFEKLDSGTYVVIATFANHKEYVTDSIVIPAVAPIVLNIAMVAAPTELLAVTVSARKPLVEQKDDKMIYNAEADPSNESQTASDMLKKVPMLSVDGDGTVRLNGQTNFKIFLNGKPTSMFAKDPKEALKAFAANIIKKVEVITSPGAKYDAEGIGGIINIVTKKKVVGYNGSIGGNYNVVLNTFNINTNANAKYGAWGFSMNYGANSWNAFGAQSSITTAKVPSFFNRRELIGERVSSGFWQWGNAELSFDLDSLNTFSSYLNINGGTNEGSANTTSSTFTNAGVLSGEVNNSYAGAYPSGDWGIDYIRKFKENEDKEFSLHFNHEFSRDKNENFSEMLSANFGNRYLFNSNNSRNNEYTFQADLVLPLTKGQQLETGAKAILRSAESDYKAFVKYDKTGLYLPAPQNTDLFDYDQKVYSAYATYAFKIKKFNIKIGSRVEYTQLQGDFRTKNAQVQQVYWSFIPNVGISTKIKDLHTISLNYSRRLQRPYIWDLSPFEDNTDSLNISLGNPDLQPDIRNNIELAYNASLGATNINLRVSQNFGNTAIVSIAQFNPATGATRTLPDNVGIVGITNINGSFNIRISKKWNWSGNLYSRYVRYANKLNEAQRNSGWGGGANTNTSFNLSNRFAISGNAGYWQNEPNLLGDNGGNIWYGLSFVYKMFDNKLRLSVSANNFGDQFNVWRSTRADANFSTITETAFQFRSISVGLRWNFGKLSENVSRKRGVEKDDLKSK